MVLARSRSLFFMAFVASCLVLSAAVYLQSAAGFYPCSLYRVQRFFIAAFAAVCLVAGLHGAGARGSRVYAWTGLCTAIGGTTAAVRQLWLQGQTVAPESICEGGLRCLVQPEPVTETLSSLLLGSELCARVNWSLLDMTWPEWSLLAFVAMVVFCLLQLLQQRRPRATAFS